MRIWLDYIFAFFCFRCCSLSLMTDCQPTWPPKPALGPVVRAWLTAAWHRTLNRLHLVYVKCICAAIVDGTTMHRASPVELTCYQALGIGSTERAGSLFGRSVIAPQNYKLSKAEVWIQQTVDLINLQQAEEPWSRSCSRHQLKKIPPSGLPGEV